MGTTRRAPDDTIVRLDEIDTDWALIKEPPRMVMRYARAIQQYFGGIIRNPEDAEEASQEFFLRIEQHGFARANRERGRFRDYLKTAIRHAALSYMERRSRLPKDSGLMHLLKDEHESADEWTAHWRRCLLNRALQRLKTHQQQSPGNLCYLVLRLRAQYARENSEALAARVSRAVGHHLGADAFRKQLSRARRLFAQALVDEIAQTLNNPQPERIEEELIDLGLMQYVRGLLPIGWQPSNNHKRTPTNPV